MATRVDAATVSTSNRIQTDNLLCRFRGPASARSLGQSPGCKAVAEILCQSPVVAIRLCFFRGPQRSESSGKTGWTAVLMGFGWSMAGKLPCRLLARIQHTNARKCQTVGLDMPRIRDLSFQVIHIENHADTGRRASGFSAALVTNRVHFSISAVHRHPALEIAGYRGPLTLKIQLSGQNSWLFPGPEKAPCLQVAWQIAYRG